MCWLLQRAGLPVAVPYEFMWDKGLFPFSQTLCEEQAAVSDTELDRVTAELDEDGVRAALTVCAMFRVPDGITLPSGAWMTLLGALDFAETHPDLGDLPGVLLGEFGWPAFDAARVVLRAAFGAPAFAAHGDGR